MSHSEREPLRSLPELETDAEPIPDWLLEEEGDPEDFIAPHKSKRGFPGRKPKPRGDVYAQRSARWSATLVLTGTLVVLLLLAAMGSMFLVSRSEQGASMQVVAPIMWSDVTEFSFESLGLTFTYPSNWVHPQQVNDYMIAGQDGSAYVVIGRAQPAALVDAGVFSNTDPEALLTAWNSGEPFALPDGTGQLHQYPDGLTLNIFRSSIAGRLAWVGYGDGGFRIAIIPLENEWVFFYGSTGRDDPLFAETPATQIDNIMTSLRIVDRP